MRPGTALLCAALLPAALAFAPTVLPRVARPLLPAALAFAPTVLPRVGRPLRTSALAAAIDPPSSKPPVPVEPELQVWQALLALNAATLIWGSQHAVIKDVVEAMTPASLNAARFAIAALASLPWLPGAPWRRGDAGGEASATVGPTWAAGAELGAFSFAGFALQAVGLQFTTASRSAFLLYLNVKLVPLLALILYGRSSPARTWVSAFVALCGTALLSFDGAPPNLGDAWSISIYLYLLIYPCLSIALSLYIYIYIYTYTLDR